MAGEQFGGDSLNLIPAGEGLNLYPLRGGVVHELGDVLLISVVAAMTRPGRDECAKPSLRLEVARRSHARP